MDALTIAASGMRSAEARIGASAHNVANLETDPVKPLRTTQLDVAGGGSAALVRQTDAPQPVDLGQEAVEQILASLQFNASLRVFSVAGELRGRIVDVLA